MSAIFTLNIVYIITIQILYLLRNYNAYVNVPVNSIENRIENNQNYVCKKGIDTMVELYFEFKIYLVMGGQSCQMVDRNLDLFFFL